MGVALEKEDDVYRLFVRCSNCLRDTTVDISIPFFDAEFDEFHEHPAVSGLNYQCSRCESVIGQIVGVTRGA